VIAFICGGEPGTWRSSPVASQAVQATPITSGAFEQFINGPLRTPDYLRGTERHLEGVMAPNRLEEIKACALRIPMVDEQAVYLREDYSSDLYSMERSSELNGKGSHPGPDRGFIARNGTSSKRTSTP